MDRTLDHRSRVHQAARRARFPVVLLIVLTAGIIYGPQLLRPKISRSWIRSAEVERGLVEEIINANGTVVPEFEQVLSSPIDTRILQVYRVAGSELKAGDSVLGLDMSATRLELESVENELVLAGIKKDALALDAERKRSTLSGELDAQRLQLAFLSAQARQESQLYELGGTPRDEMLRAQLAEQKARVENERLVNELNFSEQESANRLRELEANMAILRKRRDDIQRRLALAACRAERDAVLTWVAENIGATVPRGTVLARIADLGSYCVKASVAEVHSGKLHIGMPVRVRVQDTILGGNIAAIPPAVEQGLQTFVVQLTEKNNPLLRPNMRVEVIIVANTRRNVLRLERGPFADGASVQQVFVLGPESARKRSVHLGVTGYDCVEILSGLAEGERVIISDMKDYLHVQEVMLKE